MSLEEALNFLKEKKDDVRWCKVCEKEETRSECSYGPKIWDKYTIKPVNNINEDFEKMF